MTLDVTTLVGLHTVLSLVALGSGAIVVAELLRARSAGAWTALFLATAVATNATGFLFKSAAFGASHWVGVLSLVALALAVVARYVLRLAGTWRRLYALGAVLALYFLVFVGIAQLFQRVPALQALAPTLAEPPFAYAQLVALAVFTVLAVAAVRRFRAPSRFR